MTSTDVGNNGTLPPAREAVIDQAHRLHQEVAHDRDLLREEVRRLKADITGYKVALEAKDAQISDLESRMNSAYLVRDDMVAKAEQRGAVLTSIDAMLRAFEIEAAPHIRKIEEDLPAIGGA